MLESIEESARPLSDVDIQAFEKKLKVHLTEDYKSFLLRYNGGRPNPACFPITGLAKNHYGGIQVFFGIEDDLESCTLGWNYEVMKGRLPSTLFPIANDDSGDLLCLSLSGENRGRIYFWDYYGELNPPTFENVYFVANSFDELLDDLFESPDE